MAPIIKTRRRAEAELAELHQWFSGVLDDQSHFMRYENITYPTVTYEQLGIDFDDGLIDDEFRTGHQIWHWRQLEELTKANYQFETNNQVDGHNQQRWFEFRIMFPLFMAFTGVAVLLPILINAFFGMFWTLTSWFSGAEKDYMDPERTLKEAKEKEEAEKNRNEDDNSDSDDENEKSDESGTVNKTKTKGDDAAAGSSISQTNQPLTVPDPSITFTQPTPFIQQHQQNVIQQQQYLTKAATNTQSTLITGPNDLVETIKQHHFSQENQQIHDDSDK